MKKGEPKGIQRLLYRSWTYLQMGYSVVSMPFTVLGLGSAVYLVIRDIPFFKELHYSVFLVLLILLGLPTTTGVGWWVYKRSHVYRQAQTVAVESSPYSHWKLTEKERMTWPLTYRMAKHFNLPAENIAWIEDVANKNGVKLDG